MLWDPDSRHSRSSAGQDFRVLLFILLASWASALLLCLRFKLHGAFAELHTGKRVLIPARPVLGLATHPPGTLPPLMTQVSFSALCPTPTAGTSFHAY